MKNSLTEAQAKTLLENKLLHFFGVSPKEANYEQFYRAVALILVDIMAKERADFNKRSDKAGSKRIYYLSMEFLMGRSLKNNLFNLNLTKTFEKVLKGYNINLDALYDCEPDAGLGNGGLGRLAACYLDGLATSGYPARGYSILYEFGIFRQKLIEGWQTELPDEWLPGGDVWLQKREESSVMINFEGRVEDSWRDGRHQVEIIDPYTIKAVPYDMFVAGKDGRGVSVLRLWSSEGTKFDMSLFNQGEHLKAIERNAMASTISKVLYPSDNHPEGKSLRLKQQYFLVSASIQDIMRRHLREYGSIDNMPEKMAIHVNDTHPTLVIPEIMRILLDECGYGWDDAWRIVTSTVAYTNHTVMAEALECWSEELVIRLLPRIYQIIKEIDNRFRSYVWECTHDADYVERTAVISGGAVKMANLCVAACHSVNGVSALHSQILKDTVFNDYYRLTPEKFTNVTNGIAHRRWLCQANPELTSLLCDTIGDGFIVDGSELSKFKAFADDKAVLEKLGKIKNNNKKRFADYIYKTTGVKLDTDSVFDIQVKRLHEYKRQEMNALHILNKYLEIKENPNGNHTPHTYIFGAKAAPGYYFAKEIIRLIWNIGEEIAKDPVISQKLRVIFLENYNVTEAETLIPAAELSQQISLAGKEASGTGCMKLMINGALTIGTADGANIEMSEEAGDGNLFTFGLSATEVENIRTMGYHPGEYYNGNSRLQRVVNRLNQGFNGQSFAHISKYLLADDPFMCMADFESYRMMHNEVNNLYENDPTEWNRKSLMNIAGAGKFAADRAVTEYADRFWNIKRMTGKK